MKVHRPCWLLVLSLAAYCVADVPSEDLMVGGEIRLRAEGFDNALDLEDDSQTVGTDSVMVLCNDAYEYLRLRARVWATATPSRLLTLFFRLGNEYRMGRGEASGVKDAESKMSVDNAWARISRRRMSLTFGRMDLQYGEGFLLFDGTPADGSSSTWFDAIKLSVNRIGGTLDLLFAQIDEEGFGGSSRDEDLFGLYATQGSVETYVLRRTKQQSTTSASGTVLPRGATTAVGARVVRQPKQGVSYAGEGAYQRGESGQRKREGYGGYGRVAWRGGGIRAFGAEIGGLYLSGDDQATDRDEGWDGFYAEWPKYSELLVYTLYDNTTRLPNEPGTWTNMIAGWLEAGVDLPIGRLYARVFPCWAAQKNGPGRGTRRGLLLTARLETRVVEGVDAQLWGEVFDPGDYYLPSADPAYYGRWQIAARF